MNIKTKLICFMVISIVTFLLYTQKEIHVSKVKYFDAHVEGSEKKVILYYTKCFNDENFYFGSGDIFKDCPVRNCYATSNKLLMPIEKFDALMFHGYEYDSLKKKPKKRSPHQRYIFFNLESAANTKNLDKFGKFYNWTMTFRKDSDFIRPYGSVVKKDTSYTLPSVESIKKRKHKIAWFVSHCKTKGFREKLVKEMQKYVDIDIYGRCGNKTCSRDSNKCYDYLEKNYKFYLSFENTVCNDYVTEKLFNILDKNVIPIVYGGANYSAIAPPHSVIDVSKFQTVPDLVNYINKIDSNITAYMNFFNWKKHYVTQRSFKNTLCNLCKKLNEKSEKVYSDIQMWWNGVNMSQCSTFPQIIKSII
ncbi:unnamed protein product [Brassicogethes aeneus]|uniref:Fucosyltransferase n=1 Tax=Brassicogethes aeneus TaxID=1431903 RepID=A0A9P0B7D5_BRAAE|nr:unnamed protein product [Brassicogethes aeneus]